MNPDSPIQTERATRKGQQSSLETEEYDAADEEEGIGDTENKSSGRERANRSEQARTHLSSELIGGSSSGMRTEQTRKSLYVSIAAIFLVICFATIGTVVGLKFSSTEKVTKDESELLDLSTSVPNVNNFPQSDLNVSSGNSASPSVVPTEFIDVMNSVTPSAAPTLYIFELNETSNTSVDEGRIMVVMEITERPLTSAEIDAATANIVLETQSAPGLDKVGDFKKIDGTIR
mmetsp:Transcript_16231/g.44939  ORF Transcript_16231/g.44939 Transcript_16231/m.44939 type:complete len:232 (-) Transcript_16231:143-838(-)|eukprot:CAMPEP_0172355932 /NCGR_PEP_ID=MMETSP1060-20121228/306_1 /TAXON_ID=37318 /ORGANISM="Pseudo-nitzschia pungens, Strain cf. cingulata" /LENGTH=231 /DNA_ID=CAMNT_0013075799 /DNA_START=62 /DNA_END=757 /DNA_ORIENTATION=+